MAVGRRGAAWVCGRGRWEGVGWAKWVVGCVGRFWGRLDFNPPWRADLFVPQCFPHIALVFDNDVPFVQMWCQFNICRKAGGAGAAIGIVNCKGSAGRG